MNHRTAVAPLPNTASRPLWSVMIPTYNCARYLRQTLTSVLAQDPGPEVMQIEVIDDHSTDDPAAIVAEVGKGRVGFFQQPENVGHIKNFATCLQRSRGRLVHLLHGDDGVREGFYSKVQQAFEQRPDIGAAFCRQIFIDSEGHWRSISPLEQNQSGILENWLERLASEQRIMTPSIVVRRDVYEQLGGFDQRLVCAEDWEMWVRIAARFPIWYEVEPLALYRMHSNSNTGRHVRSADDIRYTRLAIDLFEAYLPVEQRQSILQHTRTTYAIAALRTALQLVSNLDMAAAVAQAREALMLSRSPRVIRGLIRLALRAIVVLARQSSRRAISHSPSNAPNLGRGR